MKLLSTKQAALILDHVDYMATMIESRGDIGPNARNEVVKLRHFISETTQDLDSRSVIDTNEIWPPKEIA